MFDWSWTVLLGIAARTAIVYLLLLIGIRLAGKREIGQLTPFDLVVLLLLSNAVQNAMTGPDTTVSGGVAAALTLLLLNAGVARLRLRSSRWRRFVEGIPVVLVTHGEVQYRALARERLAYEELLAALRQHEVSSVAEVELAMLEVDGSVTVIRRNPGEPGQVFHSRKRLVRHHRANN